VENSCTGGQATDDNIVRRMRFACWIAKATDTHSEYVKLTAFPQWQWLRERALLLRLQVHGLSCFRLCSDTEQVRRFRYEIQKENVPVR
jgi:hypothetical protein